LFPVLAQHRAIQILTRRCRPSGSTSWREESAAKRTRRTRRRERRKRRKKIIKEFDLGKYFSAEFDFLVFNFKKNFTFEEIFGGLGVLF
jgi:hypothetical protein